MCTRSTQSTACTWWLQHCTGYFGNPLPLYVAFIFHILFSPTIVLRNLTNPPPPPSPRPHNLPSSSSSSSTSTSSSSAFDRHRDGHGTALYTCTHTLSLWCATIDFPLLKKNKTMFKDRIALSMLYHREDLPQEAPLLWTGPPPRQQLQHEQSPRQGGMPGGCG